jgi:hypothetical protein
VGDSDGHRCWLESRISEAFWGRKSDEWEEELGTITAELERLSGSTPTYVAAGARILELAKQAHFLYLKQDPTEQRRLLETVLSNCTFDRGSLCPTYSKPFDLFVNAAILRTGGEAGIRTLTRRRS